MSNALLTELWKERSKRNKKKEKESTDKSNVPKPIVESILDIAVSDDEMEIRGGGGGGDSSHLEKSTEETQDIKHNEISSDEDNSSSDFIDKDELEKDNVRPPDKEKMECLMDESGSASASLSPNIFGNRFDTEMYDREMEYALKLSKESVHNTMGNNESDILGIVDDDSRFEKEIQDAIKLSKAKDDTIDQETLDLIKTLDKSDKQDNKSYMGLSREDQIKNDEFFAKAMNS